MDANLVPFAAALAEMSDAELHALTDATHKAPQTTPGLLAWIDAAFACELVSVLQQGFHWNGGAVLHAAPERIADGAFGAVVRRRGDDRNAVHQARMRGVPPATRPRRLTSPGARGPAGALRHHRRGRREG